MSDTHDTEELRAKLAEMQDLTPTQLRRVLATLAGKTQSEIAAAEGVSKQAVAKTVATPRVRNTVRDLITYTYSVEMKDGIEEKTSLVEGAIRTLYTLLEAEKAVVFGGSYAMVPDSAVRLAAALKIIELYEPPQSSRQPDATPATVEESLVEETATRRVARRRRSTG
jgi:DNA-binding CsgD family transcriptional regulator